MPTCIPRMRPKRYSRPICAPRVEAEQISRQIAEIAVAQGPREAMCHAERALELRQAQRRRKVYEREVGLREVDVEIGIVLRLRGQWRRNRKKQGESRCMKESAFHSHLNCSRRRH